MTVGKNITYYREKIGMKKEEFANLLAVSVEKVDLWESDKLLPTIDFLMKIKNVLKVSIDDILSVEEEGLSNKNPNSLDTICATLAYAFGIEPPKFAAEKNQDLAKYIDEVFGGEKADRVIMFNPDAIGEWIYKKYPRYFLDAKNHAGIEIPLSTVMPSVTPVCFGTMYTGAQPEVHGIKKYEKPIITIDTLFDALIRAGKKIAIITYENCSLAKIYLGRDEIDYFNYETEGIEAVNAKAFEVIMKDEYDFIVIYNGNYDSVMHKLGPESKEALSEIRVNCHTYSCLCELVKNNLKNQNVLVGFAMDHGCHEIDGNCGAHGLDMLEDINIVHLYKGYKKIKE